jgi:hypothetical protein
MSPDRAVHYHIRDVLQGALGDRTWRWLAEEIGVPQSTLSGQVSKPKFSVAVVWKAARVLDLDFHELMPKE